MSFSLLKMNKIVKFKFPNLGCGRQNNDFPKDIYLLLLKCCEYFIWVDAKVIVVLHCSALSFDIGIYSYINVVMLYIILMHFSCFMFFLFANDLLLIANFISILDYRNVIRPKANLSNFLIQVKNGS